MSAHYDSKKKKTTNSSPSNSVSGGEMYLQQSSCVLLTIYEDTPLTHTQTYTHTEMHTHTELGIAFRFFLNYFRV